MKKRIRFTAAAAMAAAIAPLHAEESAVTPPVEVPAAQPAENMPETPADVAAPPADAEKTESGLASKVLTPGTGDQKPTATDTVTVHYSGWTTDGKLFDSSVKRGQPTSFPLNGVIKGWTEGLQLMTVGEKRRFWIPADLAYGENPGGGRPGGLLVFDVELLGIKEVPKVPADAEKTADGVAFQKVSPATAEGKPAEGDLVTFHFKGSTMEGQDLQDTHQQPTPPTVPLAQLPPEMKGMLGDMGPGEVRKAWLPEARLPGGFIVAELELISFKPAPPAPEAPEEVAAVPADAAKTESGLASKVLTAAPEGAEKPKATDTVKVHYTGWTTDGKMFDSSVVRDEPAEFPLNGVIKGWTEGVQLMGVGEKRRFWIPADLAYGENPGGGRPGGMLVFDVELLEIVK
ncbi:FKBP-type peptidyl-prolyl cis-trans isomerase [Haloferula luteola]|uniref:peptidylprolyl isomerase n=1 Tax=Haloferula luteola TaxID=595692 RepID=A0A840V2F3_9BACT|nr:FKBP-type peptidyl-prolyl cis-trans isomerase [Haloferula luteola]MBB5352172.1 FKBP-type peptidyl-prolyl cis-trans isomerase [Haloferula luteola]